MTARLLDGIALSQTIREGLRLHVQTLAAQGVTPKLAVILVGQDPSSAVYVRNKVRACEQIGMQSLLEQYDDHLTQDQLLQHIARLNQSRDVHGILVQLPLPKHIDAQCVIEAIAAQKDVDGFHVANAGALLTNGEGFLPCTPYGCMELLRSIDLPLSGKHAVVLGRSNIVGKPMALMLLQANATVSICHSHTQDLEKICQSADILVAALGKPKFVQAHMVKPQAIVIDVGINRLSDGSLCGDVDFESVRHVAGFITPVPGGVGPMTITMLLSNTLKAAQGSVPKPRP